MRHEVISFAQSDRVYQYIIFFITLLRSCAMLDNEIKIHQNIIHSDEKGAKFPTAYELIFVGGGNEEGDRECDI